MSLFSAFNSTQHRDVENPMLREEHPTISFKRKTATKITQESTTKIILKIIKIVIIMNIQKIYTQK